jgi:hypothetical protein
MVVSRGVGFRYRGACEGGANPLSEFDHALVMIGSAQWIETKSDRSGVVAGNNRGLAAFFCLTHRNPRISAANEIRLAVNFRPNSESSEKSQLLDHAAASSAAFVEGAAHLPSAVPLAERALAAIFA